MKKFILAMAAVFMVVAFATPQDAQAGAMSLRGDRAITDSSDNPEFMKPDTSKDKIQRNFKQQPPLVPHKVKKYQVNLKNNKCLSCHDKPNYKEEEAPMVGKSHYMRKDGTEGKTINMGRYFCMQCHVGQANAKPLVDNTFSGAK